MDVRTWGLRYSKLKNDLAVILVSQQRGSLQLGVNPFDWGTLGCESVVIQPWAPR